MKKIISTCIALMVSAACSISAFAMEVPTNTTIQDLNGVRQYIKIYTVAPDTDPQSLIDDVFEYDGYAHAGQPAGFVWQSAIPQCVHHQAAHLLRYSPGSTKG